MKIMKRMFSLLLIVCMVLSCSVTAFAAETVHSQVGNTPIVHLVSADDEQQDLSETIVPRSAGLAWGPVTIGNVKLYMTNSHTGIVPGFGSTSVSHINFHADNAKTGKAILNYHIVKYTSGDSSCLYVYDSVAKKVVFNNCFKSWTDAAGAVIESVKSALSAILSEADFIASVLIWAAVIVVLADLIIPMDPVPVLPFSIEVPTAITESNYEANLSVA